MGGRFWAVSKVGMCWWSMWSSYERPKALSPWGELNYGIVKAFDRRIFGRTKKALGLGSCSVAPGSTILRVLHAQGGCGVGGWGLGWGVGGWGGGLGVGVGGWGGGKVGLPEEWHQVVEPGDGCFG